MARYTLVPKSVSAHCCFEATVLDTAGAPGPLRYKEVCETFSIEDAELIKKALEKKKARIATKASKGSKEKRLESKKRKADIKSGRQKFRREDF